MICVLEESNQLLYPEIKCLCHLPHAQEDWSWSGGRILTS